MSQQCNNKSHTQKPPNVMDNTLKYHPMSLIITTCRKTSLSWTFVAMAKSTTWPNHKTINLYNAIIHNQKPTNNNKNTLTKHPMPSRRPTTCRKTWICSTMVSLFKTTTLPTHNMNQLWNYKAPQSKSTKCRPQHQRQTCCSPLSNTKCFRFSLRNTQFSCLQMHMWTSIKKIKYKSKNIHSLIWPHRVK